MPHRTDSATGRTWQIGNIFKKGRWNLTFYKKDKIPHQVTTQGRYNNQISPIDQNISRPQEGQTFFLQESRTKGSQTSGRQNKTAKIRMMTPVVLRPVLMGVTSALQLRQTMIDPFFSHSMGGYKLKNLPGTIPKQSENTGTHRFYRTIIKQFTPHVLSKIAHIFAFCKFLLLIFCNFLSYSATTKSQREKEYKFYRWIC